MQLEFFKIIKSLCDNPDIIISKLDKKSDVVILNCCDYIEKMNKILSDFKFKCLSFTTENDNIKIETKLQRQLQELNKKDEIPRSIYKVIAPLLLKDQDCTDYLKSINPFL